MRFVLLGPCLLLPVLAAAGCQAQPPPVGRKAIPVVVARPRKVDLPIQLRYPAELQAIQQADVQPMEIRGYVTRMLVDKGDVVKGGQVLARLDCTPYADERAKLEEAARQAEARERFARQTVERIKPMAAQNFVGAQELDQAASEAESSEASVAHARAALQQAQHKLGYCELTAPFAGSITMRYVDPGALVGPGNPVVSIVDGTQMRVMINVVERDLGQVRVGEEALLTVDAYPGRLFKGRVQRVVQAVDPRSRTMLVEADIPNAEGLLKPGMFGRVAITTAVHQGALVVPARALQVTEGGTYAFVTDGKTARRTRLTLAYDDGEEVEVTAGLAPTDQLVVSGQDLLGEGVAVEPHLAESDAAPSAERKN